MPWRCLRLLPSKLPAGRGGGPGRPPGTARKCTGERPARCPRRAGPVGDPGGQRGVPALLPAHQHELPGAHRARDRGVHRAPAQRTVRRPRREVREPADQRGVGDHAGLQRGTDGTFERLREAYHLIPVPRVIPDDVRVHGRVISVHVPRHSAAPLVVVRKENGGKTDSLNAGLNIARHPLVCMVDADCLLDPDALMAVSSPFAQDPLRVVATGGVIRVANGCKVVAGRVTDVRMPRRLLPGIQVVEYLRAFLLGRTGWSRLASLVIISGAFGLFRRDLVVEAGGLDPATMGEDAELVVRLHRRMRERRRDYRIVFVAEPVSWTEVPAQIRVLARQRRRWHRGLTEVLWLHRRLVGNPAYGRVGLLALPYFVIFELFAPIVELAGIAFLVLGLAAGAVN